MFKDTENLKNFCSNINIQMKWTCTNSFSGQCASPVSIWLADGWNDSLSWQQTPFPAYYNYEKPLFQPHAYCQWPQAGGAQPPVMCVVHSVGAIGAPPNFHWRWQDDVRQSAVKSSSPSMRWSIINWKVAGAPQRPSGVTQNWECSNGVANTVCADLPLHLALSCQYPRASSMVEMLQYQVCQLDHQFSGIG